MQKPKPRSEFASHAASPTKVWIPPEPKEGEVPPCHCGEPGIIGGYCYSHWQRLHERPAGRPII
jgi:hypothetical protein